MDQVITTMFERREKQEMILTAKPQNQVINSSIESDADVVTDGPLILASDHVDPSFEVGIEEPEFLTDVQLPKPTPRQRNDMRSWTQVVGHHVDVKLSGAMSSVDRAVMLDYDYDTIRFAIMRASTSICLPNYDSHDYLLPSGLSSTERYNHVDVLGVNLLTIFRHGEMSVYTKGWNTRRCHIIIIDQIGGDVICGYGMMEPFALYGLASGEELTAVQPNVACRSEPLDKMIETIYDYKTGKVVQFSTQLTRPSHKIDDLRRYMFKVQDEDVRSKVRSEVKPKADVMIQLEDNSILATNRSKAAGVYQNGVEVRSIYTTPLNKMIPINCNFSVIIGSGKFIGQMTKHYTGYALTAVVRQLDTWLIFDFVDEMAKARVNSCRFYFVLEGNKVYLKYISGLNVLTVTSANALSNDLINHVLEIYHAYTSSGLLRNFHMIQRDIACGSYPELLDRTLRQNASLLIYKTNSTREIRSISLTYECVAQLDRQLKQLPGYVQLPCGMLTTSSNGYINRHRCLVRTRGVRTLNPAFSQDIRIDLPFLFFCRTCNLHYYGVEDAKYCHND